ncbi:hypothetical protein TNCV_4611601 [Trichonephila clavipes]|nr:hypothetical protein TNCV_4611601 [Trichonephila clavipes]
MLNGLLHSNDYENRRVTRYTEVLSTTAYSKLDTRAVVNPWEEKLQKSFYFLTYLPFINFIQHEIEKSGTAIPRLTLPRLTRFSDLIDSSSPSPPSLKLKRDQCRSLMKLVIRFKFEFLARQINLEVDRDDVQEQLDSYNQDLTIDELTLKNMIL